MKAEDNNDRYEKAFMIGGDKLRDYGLVASFYFVVVGVLYLWGYWSSFEINVLEYISFTDIAKVTLIPIVSSFIVFASGVVVGELLGVQLPSGGGAETPVGRFLNKNKSLLFKLYWAGAILIYYFGPVEKWLILTVLISAPISIFLRSQQFLRDLIPHDGVNRTTVFLLCALPVASYGHGVISADTIIKGGSYKYIEIETSKLKIGTPGPDLEKYQKMKLVGLLNDYVFLMPTEGKAVIITKLDSIAPITVRRYSKSD